MKKNNINKYTFMIRTELNIEKINELLQGHGDILEIEEKNNNINSSIITNARLLKSEEGLNTEYDRALIEVVSYVKGISIEESYKQVGVKNEI